MFTRRTSSRIKTNQIATSFASSSLVVVSGPRVFPSELVSMICGFATKGTIAQLARVSKDVKVLALEALYEEVVIDKAEDYCSLFSTSLENVRTKTQTLNIRAFPPPQLFKLGFFLPLESNPIQIPNIIYHKEISFLASTFRFMDVPTHLFSPSSIEIHPRATFTLKNLDDAWTFGCCFLHSTNSKLSSIIYPNVERCSPFKTASYIRPSSPSRKSYPVLEQIVLRLAPGVGREDMEKDLEAWFEALRTNRRSDGWQEREADWRRVLVVEEA